MISDSSIFISRGTPTNLSGVLKAEGGMITGVDTGGDQPGSLVTKEQLDSVINKVTFTVAANETKTISCGSSGSNRVKAMLLFNGAGTRSGIAMIAGVGNNNADAQRMNSIIEADGIQITAVNNGFSIANTSNSGIPCIALVFNGTITIN